MPEILVLGVEPEGGEKIEGAGDGHRGDFGGAEYPVALRRLDHDTLHVFNLLDLHAELLHHRLHLAGIDISRKHLSHYPAVLLPLLHN